MVALGGGGCSVCAARLRLEIHLPKAFAINTHILLYTCFKKDMMKKTGSHHDVTLEIDAPLRLPQAFGIWVSDFGF